MTVDHPTSVGGSKTDSERLGVEGKYPVVCRGCPQSQLLSLSLRWDGRSKYAQLFNGHSRPATIGREPPPVSRQASAGNRSPTASVFNHSSGSLTLPPYPNHRNPLLPFFPPSLPALPLSPRMDPNAIN